MWLAIDELWPTTKNCIEAGASGAVGKRPASDGRIGSAVREIRRRRSSLRLIRSIRPIRRDVKLVVEDDLQSIVGEQTVDLAVRELPVAVFADEGDDAVGPFDDGSERTAGAIVVANGRTRMERLGRDAEIGPPMEGHTREHAEIDIALVAGGRGVAVGRVGGSDRRLPDD